MKMMFDARLTMEIDMRNPLAVAIVSAVGLTATLALADDKTPSNYTPEVQAELKHETEVRHRSMVQMTPEERAAARKARNAETQKNLDTIIKKTQDPKDELHMQINRTAASSRAGPTPLRGMSTPEWDKELNEEKGQ